MLGFLGCGIKFERFVIPFMYGLLLVSVKIFYLFIINRVGSPPRYSLYAMILAITSRKFFVLNLFFVLFQYKKDQTDAL
ncbi:hypothetical protein ATZ36_07920 [Candidatus Endomicrobiellum trichonymphae]|uniref:Uncharacterized protein n=1 Tax=Endomicrobium trichonymphae TaxID=1408204 RepID=A0A1E5IGN3_ENDTX|nr:hypothetical protein ATZ36_08555 [Candidatus Endomicrobium trichonymphae]OEG69704.1 hypothetical protein ATZ36_07920 [Candidatus Endomicrobium trichonymphae]